MEKWSVVYVASVVSFCLSKNLIFYWVLVPRVQNETSNSVLGMEAVSHDEETLRLESMSWYQGIQRVETRSQDEGTLPSSRDLPGPGIESGCPALQVDSLPSEPPGMPWSL